MVLLNRHNELPAARISVRWEALGYPPGARATVRDLYARLDLGVFSGVFTAEVGVHDVAALRITPLEAVLGADEWRPWQGQPMYAAEEREWGPDAARAGDVRTALAAEGMGSSAGQCCAADDSADGHFTVS